MGDDINSQGSSRRNITASVEASLKRLKTSHIDIYLLHRFDPFTPLEETLSTMKDIVAQLDDSLRSMDVEMTDELYSELCSLTPTPAPATDRTEEFPKEQII